MDGLLEWKPFQAAYNSTASARHVLFQTLRAEYPKQPIPTLPPEEEQSAPTQTPERRKTPPLVGVATWTPDNQHLPEWANAEILSAVNLTDNQGAVFLDEIEDAFTRALLRPEFQTKRAETKRALLDVEATAAKLVEALDNVSMAGQRYIRSGGILFSQFLQQARDQAVTARWQGADWIGLRLWRRTGDEFFGLSQGLNLPVETFASAFLFICQVLGGEQSAHFPMSHSRFFRVNQQSWKGHDDLIASRVWVKNKDGTERPSGNGITVRRPVLVQLIPCLEETIKSLGVDLEALAGEFANAALSRVEAQFTDYL
jgi:hypothetical protein